MEAMQGSLATDTRPRGAARTEAPVTSEADDPPPAPAAPASAAAVAEAVRPAAPTRPMLDLETMRNAGFVVTGAGAMRSRVTEELSVVQHQIRRTVQSTEAAEGRVARLVLVTCAKPGEGKTFCSMNIAARLALGSAEQVILVDGDGKAQGSLTQMLGQQDTPGLRVLAVDPEERPEPLLVPTAIERLHFLPYGPGKADATELPSGIMLAAAVERLAKALPHHIIIFDAPPCLYTSEPSAIASVAGQVLLVVRAESTQRDEVEAALDMVESCPTLQLLLNRTRMVSKNTFGAYGYYGYYNG
jgi:receptor protein-tyrosine kinase